MCYKLWAAMANKKWKNKEERQISYSYSFRTAGGILAQLINKENHEQKLDYLDFYCCSDSEIPVDKEIERMMADHGWSWEVFN